MCCGPRMFWFNRENGLATYLDKRKEQHNIDVGTPHTVGRKPAIIKPEILANFENLPFKENTFSLVVFDPPHLKRKQTGGSIFAKRYGYLIEGWQDSIRKGFSESFRVLKTDGILVFKWSEKEIPLRKISKLFGYVPLFGHRSGKALNTHWLCFMKNDYQLDILN